MAQKLIIVGTPNSREGDSLFKAFTTINENFTDLYNNTASGSSDRLVNGNSSFSISTDGTLTLTHPAEPNYHPLSTTLTIQKAAGNYHTISGAYGLSLQATPVPSGNGLNTNTNFVDIFHDGISVNVNDNTWGFGSDGALTFPNGSTIGAGDAVFGVPITTTRGSILIGNQAECIGGENHFHIMKAGQQGIDLFLGDDNNYVKLPSTGGVEISSSELGAQHYWTFGTDGTLTLPGAFAYPNSALQRDTATVTCQGNATTVVYTVSGQYQHAIKLFIQVEGSAPGQPYDTQACEMIIAKSFRANDIAATVYGIVHTSVAPLATFTALWNALTNRVEVLCATTAIAVNVRTFATEITTSD